MQLNSSTSLKQAVSSQTICSQYLRRKVSLFTVIRKTKRVILSMALTAINCFALLASCGVAGLLFFSNSTQAVEKDVQLQQQKQAVMPMDLMELLGELGDDEADLDAAMSSLNSKEASKQVAKQLPQSKSITKPIATENSTKGAKE